MEELCGTNNYTLTRMGKNIKIEIPGRNKYYMLKYDGTVNKYDKIEKIAATDEMYGYLDEENEILYLRATSKTGYSQLTQQLPEKSYKIKNNFDESKIKTISIEEPVAPISGYYMFQGCTKLENIENIENLHTENMNSFMAMFQDCSSLKQLDLSGFDTSKVTSMPYMFHGCRTLESLNFETFNTSNVGNMRTMFQGCNLLKQLDLSSFNTSKVTTMADMFYGCRSLTIIDVSSFDTSACKAMDILFLNCNNLEIIDISNFDTKLVTNMRSMFGGCSKLKTIYVSYKFATTSVTNSTDMFSGTSLLVGGAGTHSTGGDATYAHIDGGEDNPGYFTQK